MTTRWWLEVLPLCSLLDLPRILGHSWSCKLPISSRCYLGTTQCELVSDASFQCRFCDSGLHSYQHLELCEWLQVSQRPYPFAQGNNNLSIIYGFQHCRRHQLQHV